MQTRIAAGRVYNYKRSIGTWSGPRGACFSLPVDMALSRDQSFHVLNRGHEGGLDDPRITVFTYDEEWLYDIGSQGEGDGQFIWPSGITLDDDENVYVSDDWLHRITVFDRSGRFLTKWGKRGSGDGELECPSGLAFDVEGNLFVSDTHNHRIQRFTRDGNFLLKWGSQGADPGQLNLPWGITVDSAGDVWVADWGNNRVQKFSPEGNFLASLGASGTGHGYLSGPSDVAVDKDGDVYVVDRGNDQVHVFDPEGSLITTFAGDARQLSKWAEPKVYGNPDYLKAWSRAKRPELQWAFALPTSVIVSDHGEIIVTDTIRCRVQIYQKEESYVEPQFNL